MVGARRRAKPWLPLLYVAVAMLAAVIVLPSVLRPPPDPADTSGALNPNAPPNPNNQTQFIESLQQAGGGGAGAQSGTTTTTVPAATRPANPIKQIASLDYCYGNPPRQIPSVYAGPCVGAWQGNNGGSTWKNVFPNEIRIGFNNLDSPDMGPVPSPSTNNGGTDSQTITWQVLTQYFNEHYQFYNRKVVFYGIGDPSSSTSDSEAASAVNDYDTYKLFMIYSTHKDVCEDFAQQTLVAFCDPLPHADYLADRPNLWTGQDMDLTELFGFGAEFLCKTLKDKPAQYGGAAVKNKTRKFGIVTWNGADGGIDANQFATAYSTECGGQIETATLNGGTDTSGASAAIARFKADGVTSVVFALPVGDILLTMTAATVNLYQPEWVILGSYAIDNNTIATVLPKDQTAHLFGISSLEWPQVPASTECYQAFLSIDPNGSPNGTTCYLFWRDLVWMANGIQGAGPDLTPASFQQALFNVGYHFGQTAWSQGGGFGPGDYSYPDSVAEVWYDGAVPDPSTGIPGAYMWTLNGQKFQRGQLPDANTQFFRSGAAGAPES